MKALVVYYSRTGNTRDVAAGLAKELDAESEEIRCDRYPRGLLGYLRAGRDIWKGDLPPLGPLSRSLTDFDLVVVGGPVWSFHISAPVRAFLRREAAGLPRVAFFLTHGGSSARRAFAEMAEAAGKAPAATLAVRAAEIASRKYAPAVAAFAAALRQSKAA